MLRVDTTAEKDGSSAGRVAGSTAVINAIMITYIGGVLKGDVYESAPSGINFSIFRNRPLRRHTARTRRSQHPALL